MTLPQRDIDPPLFDIVEGWTGKIGPFTLALNEIPLDLTGLTVTLILHRASGALVTPGGAIEVLNQTSNRGQVNYTPVASDFVWENNLYTVHQPYQLHWKVVDGVGQTVFVPSKAASIVMVHRA